MFCPNCGTQLEDGLKFCTQCGTAQVQPEAQPIPVLWTEVPATTQKERGKMNTAGFVLGIINLLNIILVYLTRDSITLPEEDRGVIIGAWLVVTIILAITGFCVSKSGVKSDEPQKGLGITGMALNGLVILPALIFLIFIVLDAASNKNKNQHITVHHQRW